MTLIQPVNNFPKHKIQHGGELLRASQTFGIESERWVDLSTGISPDSYPAPPVPESVWQRLPDEQDGLLQSAADYYGCQAQQLLAVPGSQFAIQMIPQITPSASVAIPLWGYEEHRHCWEQAGHNVLFYENTDALQQLISADKVQHAVVINPNNPTTEVITSQFLLELAETLKGQLVVDEAFVDSTPQLSLMPQLATLNLVVLRSLGKFFGLAGLRLGFVAANRNVLDRLERVSTHWGVSHPARWLGSLAFTDRHWQEGQRENLRLRSQRWLAVLKDCFPALDLRPSHYFVTGFGKSVKCQRIYTELAEQGILVRLFQPRKERAALRFGLPTDEDFRRVSKALNSLTRNKFEGVERCD